MNAPARSEPSSGTKAIIAAAVIGAVAVVAGAIITILPIILRDDPSPTPAASGSATLTAGPTAASSASAAEETASPTATASPIACPGPLPPNELVFNCLPDGVTGTSVVRANPYPDSDLTLFMWPEQQQTDCAVNGALAILVAGDPATNLPYNVLAPSRNNDPRTCNDLGIEIRLENGARSMVIEVPSAGARYSATVWDQTVQTQLGSFEDSSTMGSDGKIAFRITSSVTFYDVFLSSLPAGTPLYVRSILVQP